MQPRIHPTECDIFSIKYFAMNGFVLLMFMKILVWRGLACSKDHVCYRFMSYLNLLKYKYIVISLTSY